MKDVHLIRRKNEGSWSGLSLKRRLLNNLLDLFIQADVQTFKNQDNSGEVPIRNGAQSICS